MFKLKVFKKTIAIIANLSLLLNSFIPFLLVAQPVYAQNSETIVSTIEYNQSANKININTNSSNKIDYQLFYKTDEKIDAIVGNDLNQTDFYLGTCSSGDCLPQNINRGILKIKTGSNQFYSKFFILENNILTVIKEIESSESDLIDEENIFLNNGEFIESTDWTFEKVELNKEYIAPQNSGVKITFTKLPEKSGNIKIEEIILTPEQIEQTSALSDKAYDITSDMIDGTFEYNLSLPIPSFVDQNQVNIKYAENISDINFAQKVDNVSNTNSSISAIELDHFTVFFAVIKTTDKNLVEKEIFKKGETVYINTAIVDVTKTKIRVKDLNGVIKKTYDETLSPVYQYQYVINSLDLVGKYSIDVGSYQIISSHKKCVWSICVDVPDYGWVWENDVDSFNVVEGICSDGVLDPDEQCDNGDQNNQICTPGYNSSCNYCDNECKTAIINNLDEIAPSVPTNGTPNNLNIATNNFDFNWDASTDNSPTITYEFQSSLNPNQINGILITSVWSSDILFNNSIHSSGAPDGTWYWQVRAIDVAGNKSNWSQIWQVTLDTKAPTATVTYSPIGPTNQSVVATLNPNEDITVTNNPGLEYTFEQNNTFTFEFKDVAGNTGSALASVDYIDKIAPLTPVLISPPINASVKGSSVTNEWSVVVDATKYIYESYHNQTATNLRWRQDVLSPNHSKTATNIADSIFWWRVKAVDSVGNESGWSELRKLVIDSTPPIITIGDYISTSTNQNITVTATTNEGSLNFDSHFFTENSSFDFIATDEAGNITTKKVTITNIDKTPPTKPLSLGFKNPDLTCGSFTNIKNITIDWVDSTDNIAVAGYDYSINYPLTNGNRGNWNTFFTQSQYRGSLNEGLHNIKIRAKDTAGNYSEWTDLCGITYDSIAPTLSSQTQFPNWYKTSVTSTFNYTDINGVVSGNNPTCDITTEGSTKTCSATPNVCDVAGNCNTTTVASNPANLDFTDPTSTINGGDNNSTVYSSSWDGSLFGTANDNLSGVAEVQVSIKNGANKYFNGSSFSEDTEFLLDATYNESTNTWGYFGLTNPLEDSYTVKSHAIDNSGNVENTYTLTIILDKTIPEVAISLNPLIPDASNGWYKTQPQITLINTDSHLDKIQYKWDNGSWVNYTAPFKLENEGAHILYYKATDLAGNASSDNGVKNIKWDQTDLENGPQNITANPNPTSGSTSKIKWEIAKDNIGIDKYEIQWKLNDNNNSLSYSKTVGAGTTEVEIDQLVEGRWTVKVIAFDQSGKTRDNSIDVIVDRTGPSAPTLILANTNTGTATLSWNAVSGAQDYIIWYGNSPGQYLYGARVGNVTSYTVEGLGSGNYYFIVKAVDSAQNQSSNSNEVNTGNISGAPGTVPGQPAEGFSSEVLGDSTENNSEENTPNENVLGVSITKKSLLDWWWLSFLLIISIYVIFKKVRSKNKNR